MEKLNLDIGKFNSGSINDISFTSVRTGIRSLDRCLSGGLRSGLTVLGALPGTGKSTLAFQIARNVSSAGTPVIIYSLEMPRNQILAKMISRQTYLISPEAAVSVTDMLNTGMNRDITDRQWEVIRQATGIIRAETENIYITESTDAGISASYISEEVSEFIRSHPGTPPLVIVDYLQCLAPDPDSRRSKTDKQAVDDSIRTLVALASEHRVCILLISSINRSSYVAHLSMSSFKETGTIEYSADTLIGMETNDLRKCGDPSAHYVTLSFLKQRYGRAGISVDLKYDPRFDNFSDDGECASAGPGTESSGTDGAPVEPVVKPPASARPEPQADNKKDLFLSLTEEY